MLKNLFFIKQSPDTATSDELLELESNLGLKFPPAFVEFCSRWNGGLLSKVNGFYPVPSSFEQFHEDYRINQQGICVKLLLGATRRLSQFSLLDQTHSSRTPAFAVEASGMAGYWKYSKMRPSDAGLKTPNLLTPVLGFGNSARNIGLQTNLALLPIAVDAFGNRLVLRSDSLCGPVFWSDQELEDYATDRPSLMPIAPNLEFFYNSLTTDTDRNW